MNANKLLCRLLLLFPVFTLFQSFPLLRWINKALLICVIIVLLFLTVRKMKKRWGSCQPQTKTITINSQLIEAPRFCIEYVMMHEFCHFIHPNHSKDFYTLLQVMMPDWKERKKMLEVTVFPYI